MTMPADRERDRRSLQELAKMATGLTPPPASVVPSAPGAPSGVVRAAEAKADDSGLVDLAAASAADPGASARAQSTPLGAQGLFDEEPARSQAPLSAALRAAPQSVPQQPVPSIPPPSVAQQQASVMPAIAAPSTARSAEHATPKKGGGAVIALVIGGVVALSAAAAGTFFFMKSHTAEPTATAVTTPAAAAAPAEPAPAKVEAADPTPAPEAAAAPEDNVKVAVAAKPGKPGAFAAAPKAAAPAAAKPEGPAKMTEKDLAAAPSGPAGDLGAAMKKEVGDEAKQTPAAATTGANTPTGNVPQKPSQGAVTGALGAVLPGARACLGPDDPISRASVVFTSGGTVQSVSVSGAASGKPAEACIKGALMKAKLAPFAEPTYTANVTVRHN